MLTSRQTCIEYGIPKAFYFEGGTFQHSTNQFLPTLIATLSTDVQTPIAFPYLWVTNLDMVGSPGFVCPIDQHLPHSDSVSLTNPCPDPATQVTADPSWLSTKPSTASAGMAQSSSPPGASPSYSSLRHRSLRSSPSWVDPPVPHKGSRVRGTLTAIPLSSCTGCSSGRLSFPVNLSDTCLSIL